MLLRCTVSGTYYMQVCTDIVSSCFLYPICDRPYHFREGSVLSYHLFGKWAAGGLRLAPIFAVAPASESDSAADLVGQPQSICRPVPQQPYDCFTVCLTIEGSPTECFCVACRHLENAFPLQAGAVLRMRSAQPAYPAGQAHCIHLHQLLGHSGVGLGYQRPPTVVGAGETT